ncbi:MAG: hypothetical protein ABSC08_20110 [Bryobacteraceae bacterium]|jgi:hypothetical protein
MFTVDINPTRVLYSELIQDAWTQTISTARNLGFAVFSSRIELPPEEWEQFILEDTPFDLTVAVRVLKVTQGLQLPAAGLEGTFAFCEAIKLPEPVFRFGIDRGLISASCSPVELAVLKKEFKTAGKSQQEMRDTAHLATMSARGF